MMLNRALALSGLMLFVLFAPPPAKAQTAAAGANEHTACPAGWVWSVNRKKCVRVPRGSY